MKLGKLKEGGNMLESLKTTAMSAGNACCPVCDTAVTLVEYQREGGVHWYPGTQRVKFICGNGCVILVDGKPGNVAVDIRKPVYDAAGKLLGYLEQVQ